MPKHFWVLFALILFLGAYGEGARAEEHPGSGAPSASSQQEAALTTVSGSTYSSKLAGLRFSAGALQPSFSPEQYDYLLHAPYETDFVEVEVIPRDPNSSLSVNTFWLKNTNVFRNQNALSVGNNYFEIVVTALDGDISIYRLNIIRGVPSSERNLKSLSFSTGRLYPSFDPSVTQYTLYVDHPVKFYTAIARTEDASSRLSFNGTATPSGGLYTNDAPLEVGTANTLNVIVSAQAGGSKTYTITIKRAENLVKSTPTGHSGFYNTSPVAKPNTETLKEQNGQVKAVVEIVKDPYAAALEAKNEPLVFIDAASGQYHHVLEVKLAPDLWKAAGDNGKALDVIMNDLDVVLKPGPVPSASKDTGARLSSRKLELSGRTEWEQKPPTASYAAAAFLLTFESFGTYTAQLSHPLDIALELNPAKVRNASSLAAYRYDEASKRWQFLGGELKPGNRYEFRSDTFGLFAVMGEDRSFSDTTGHWAESSIEIMTTKRIASGVGDGKFEPDAPVTRAEFAALLAHSMELQELRTLSFADVPGDAWYRYELGKAAAAGFIEGIDEATFAPQATITREQMAAMLMRAYSFRTKIRLNDILLPSASKFSDEASASPWAARSIRLADAVGLMNGSPDGAFHPKASATRAEAIVVLLRLINKAAS